MPAENATPIAIAAIQKRLWPTLISLRRLMYQSLIWLSVLDHEARRLGAALDTEDLQRLADPLVDCVRRNAELDRDLFRVAMLVDEQETVELTRRQASDALGDLTIFCGSVRIVGGIRHA